MLRPFLIAGTAVLAYFGMSGDPSQAQSAKPAPARAAYTQRAKPVSLDYLLAFQDAAQPPQDATQDPPEKKEQPKPQDEKDLEARAKNAFADYEKLSDMNAKWAKLCEAAQLYRSAQDAAKKTDPQTSKYKTELEQTLPYWGILTATNRIKALDPKKDHANAAEIYQQAQDAGFLYQLTRTNLEDLEKQDIAAFDKVLRVYQIGPYAPKQDPKVNPPKQDPKVEPPKQDPKQDPKVNPPKQEPKQDVPDPVELENRIKSLLDSQVVADRIKEGDFYLIKRKDGTRLSYVHEPGQVTSVLWSKEDGTNIGSVLLVDSKRMIDVDGKKCILTQDNYTRLEQYVANFFASQPLDKPEPKPQDNVPAKPKGPFDSDLLSGQVGVGPDHRAGSAYMHLWGIEALADFERDKFKISGGDELERTHIGLYAEADFNRMFDIPLRGHIAGEQMEEIMKSFSSDVTQNAVFRIETGTTSKTTTTRTYLDIGGELRLGDYGLPLELFQLEEVIDVDVLTHVKQIMFADPAGNAEYDIRNRQKFTNTTQGFQGGVKAYLLDDRVMAGLLLTYEDTDMPDFNRHIRRLRWHPLLGFLSENRTWGFSGIAGESLLSDGGERLTDPEYGAVAGAELSDRVTLAGRFSRREHPRGVMTLLYCKDNKALEYLLENERLKVNAELNLVKNISPNLIDEYLRIRDDHILRWIADKEGFKFRLEGGAARIMRNGKEEVVPVYGADFLTPVLWDTVTLGAGFYRFEGGDSKTTGVRVHVFPKNKDWKITFIGEQEEIGGLGVRDRRGLIAWDIWNK